MSRPTDQVLDTASANRAMVAVIAIMMFLTLLATAGGIATARATAALDVALTGRATVEIVTPDPAARERIATAAAARLRALPQVRGVDPVAPAAVRALVAPWLGDAADDAELPLPTLIDVDLAPGADAAMVEEEMRSIAPGAKVDPHAAVLEPVARFLVSVTTLAFALVALMLAASATVVVLSTRAGLEAHRATIDVMHLLGATDVQVARLFQRRVTRDVAVGAIAGALAGAAVVVVLAVQMARLGSALLSAGSLGVGGWIVLALLPAGFVLLAGWAARRAVVRALERTL